MEVIEPATDPFDLIVGTEQDFEAVAYLDGEPLPSEQVTWEWDFDDGSDPDYDNPTTHTFTSTGQHTVTVLATYSSMSANAEVEANVLPTYAANWDIFARPAYQDDLRFDSEVCDEIELAFRTTDMGLIFIARFSVRNPDGSWSLVGNGDWESPDIHGPPEAYAEAVSDAIDTTPDPNRTTMYSVEILVEMGGEGGPFWVPYVRHLQVSSNNTAVHGGGVDGGVLLHAQTTQHHEIAWNIAHHESCAWYDILMDEWQWVAPTFGVTVQIYALDGTTPLVTLYESGVGLGSGSLEWDGTIPGQGAAPVGIYTYKTSAEHIETGTACEDQDKSRLLSVTPITFYWFEQDPTAGTLKGVVRYTLSRAAAAESVLFRFYDHQLNSVGEVSGEDTSAGTHFSEVYTITAPYDQNGALIGPVYCVACAMETEADGQLNRDHEPKPAPPKGTTALQHLLVIPSPSTGKVLISAKHDSNYPLAQQTEDRKVELTFDYGSTFAGVTVYFVPFDPPDLSPYNSSTTWGDNPGAGSLQPTSAVLDAQGQAITVLTITNQNAGNNYVVASCPFTQPSQRIAEDLFAAGHNLVAWKRVYIEEARMYRQGADLAQTATQGNDTLILQQALAGIGVGTVLHLFDADDREGEQVEVSAVNGTTIELTDSIANTYSTASGTAVGVPTGGVFAPGWDLLPNAYGTAFHGSDGGCFVEYVQLPPTDVFVPLRSYFPGGMNERIAFRDLWFERSDESNVLWVCGASRADDAEDGTLGIAAASDNYCYVFVAAIENDPYIADPETAAADVAAHEIGHQFGRSDHDTDFPDPQFGVRNHEDTDCCVMSYVETRDDEACEFCLDEACLTGVRSEPDDL